MRIALVSNVLPPEGTGGAESYVARLAQALAARHDVLVLTGTRGATIPGVSVLPVPSLAPIGEHPVAKALWHTRDQWRLATFIGARRLLESFRPDAVQIHEPQGLSGAVFSAARQLRVPVSHCLHDYNALCVRASFFRRGQVCGRSCRECVLQRAVRGWLVRRSDVIVARSRYVADVHSELLGIPPEKIVINRHGEPDVTPRLRGLRRPLRFGYIGTLAQHKGVATLLRGWDMVRGDSELAIAGAGPMEAAVEAAAAGDTRITFYGHLRDEAKERFFERLDALVVPSEWEDVLPSVMIEAAARGIPSVASDIGGLREVPQRLAFRPGDAHGLRCALDHAVETTWVLDASAALTSMHDEFGEARNYGIQEAVFASLVEPLMPTPPDMTVTLT